jgi:hypothetical protein
MVNIKYSRINLIGIEGLSELADQNNTVKSSSSEIIGKIFLKIHPHWILK